MRAMRSVLIVLAAFFALLAFAAGRFAFDPSMPSSESLPNLVMFIACAFLAVFFTYRAFCSPKNSNPPRTNHTTKYYRMPTVQKPLKQHYEPVVYVETDRDEADLEIGCHHSSGMDFPQVNTTTTVTDDQGLSIKSDVTIEHGLSAFGGIYNAPSFSLHPDLDGLIWFSDGPLKNYFPQKHTYEQAGFLFECEALKEPSALRMHLPIQPPADPNSIPSPSYYPSYGALSPEQRWLYLSTLYNPYDTQNDIGYIFILYYGLERHLLMGEYSRAFEVVLKLRGVYSNASFQSYSLMALLVCSVLHQRKDLADKLWMSVRTSTKIDFNLLLIMKVMTDENLSADELMEYARRFGFTNTRYIKSNPDLFRSNLQQVLIEKFSIPYFPIDSLKAGAPRISSIAFANYSLPREIEIPGYSSAPKFIKQGFELLSVAHEQTKIALAKARKSQNTQ